MFSLELRNIVAPPPGLNVSYTNTAYVASAISLDDINRIDNEYLQAKEKNRDCQDCKNLLYLCDKINSQRLKSLACLLENFNIIQQHHNTQLELRKEIESLKAEKLEIGSENEYKAKCNVLFADLRAKTNVINELKVEINELNVMRVYAHKQIDSLLRTVKANQEMMKALQDASGPAKNCEECKEKDVALEKNEKIINELKENQAIAAKVVENLRNYTEKSSELNKLQAFQEVLDGIPDINGRELRISIHKKICEIETDFIELNANQESFELIKGKYLQLPYLLKPIFDLTKQYEKALFDFKKLLYN